MLARKHRVTACEQLSYDTRIQQPAWSPIKPSQMNKIWLHDADHVSLKNTMITYSRKLWPFLGVICLDNRPPCRIWVVPSVQRHKVWLTPGTRVLCSNAAKTRNPLKFSRVPQTHEPISAISGPKFTILRGHVEPNTGMPCSNAANTRNPLKFAGVPQTNETISAASRPKFTYHIMGTSRGDIAA